MSEEVLRLLRDGSRPFEIAKTLALSYEFVHKVASQSGIHFPGKHLSDEQKKLLRTLREVEGMTIRAIAAQLGVSKTTVGRWSRERYLEVQDEGGRFRPQALKEVKRCPRHGLLKIWPCVACAAEQLGANRIC